MSSDSLHSTPERLHFDIFLTSLSEHIGLRAEENHIRSTVDSPACFISYAWELGDPDILVQQTVLSQLKHDLSKLGVRVSLDLRTVIDEDSNRDSVRTCEILTCNYFILVGTPSYRKRAMDDRTRIASEFSLIEKKVVHDHSGTLLPLLFTGDFESSFPDSIMKHTAAYDFRNPKDYSRNMADFSPTIGLIPKLFGFCAEDTPYATLLDRFKKSLTLHASLITKLQIMRHHILDNDEINKTLACYITPISCTAPGLMHPKVAGTSIPHESLQEWAENEVVSIHCKTKIFLLHGATGSGKTAFCLHLLCELWNHPSWLTFQSINDSIPQCYIPLLIPPSSLTAARVPSGMLCHFLQFSLACFGTSFSSDEITLLKDHYRLLLMVDGLDESDSKLLDSTRNLSALSKQLDEFGPMMKVLITASNQSAAPWARNKDMDTLGRIEMGRGMDLDMGIGMDNEKTSLDAENNTAQNMDMMGSSLNMDTGRTDSPENTVPQSTNAHTLPYRTSQNTQYMTPQHRFIAPFTPEQTEAYMMKYIERNSRPGKSKNSTNKIPSIITPPRSELDLIHDAGSDSDEDCWTEIATYHKHLEKLPQLKALMHTTPLMLHMTMQILPSLVTEMHLKSLDSPSVSPDCESPNPMIFTRAMLYDRYVNLWFEKQANYYEYASDHPVSISKADLIAKFEQFSQKLAICLHQAGVNGVSYSPPACLSVTTHHHIFATETHHYQNMKGQTQNSMNDINNTAPPPSSESASTQHHTYTTYFHQTQSQNYATSLPPATSNSAASEDTEKGDCRWVEELFSECDAEMNLSRLGCPLHISPSSSRNYYHFLHDSLKDYFLSKAILHENETQPTLFSGRSIPPSIHIPSTSITENDQSDLKPHPQPLTALRIEGQSFSQSSDTHAQVQTKVHPQESAHALQEIPTQIQATEPQLQSSATKSQSELHAHTQTESVSSLESDSGAQLHLQATHTHAPTPTPTHTCIHSHTHSTLLSIRLLTLDQCSFLADHIRTDPTHEFEKRLFSIIENSKSSPNSTSTSTASITTTTTSSSTATITPMAIAASNAITILNLARVNFSGRDFRNVRVPFANLSGAILDNVQFQGANLQHVNLSNAWIRGCNFEGANLRNVELGAFPTMHPDSWVHSVAFSGNGKWLAVACDEVKVFDGRTREFLFSLNVQNPSSTSSYWATCVAFDPSCKFLAAAVNKSLCVWDIDFRKLVHEFAYREAGSVISVTFNCYSSLLASANSDTIHIWDLELKSCINLIPCHAGIAKSIAFHPSYGQLIASGGSDKTIFLWDLDSNKCVAKLHSHSGSVNCVTFHPSGKFLASASDDSSILLWSLDNIEQPFVMSKYTGHSRAVKCVGFSPSGMFLASASEDETAKLWHTDSGLLLGTFSGHTNHVTSVAFDPLNDVLLSGSQDKTIRVWDLWPKLYNSPSCNPSLPYLYPNDGHSDDVTCLAFGSSGTYLASSSNDCSIYVWDMTFTAQRIVHRFQGHTARVTSISFHPSGTYLASASDDGSVKLWDMGSGKLHHEFTGHLKQVLCVAYDPTGKYIVSGGEDKTICIWDTESKQLHHQFTSAHERSITCVSFYPATGRVFASGSFDKTLKLWDCQKKQLIYQSDDHSRGFWCVAFHPLGRMLASAGYDESIQLQDLASGQFMHRFCGHNAEVVSIAFDPSGRVLASCGSNDRSLRFWDVQNHTQYPLVLRFPFPVRSVVWRDTKYFAVAYGKCIAYYEVHFDTSDALNQKPVTATMRAHIAGSYRSDIEKQESEHECESVGFGSPSASGSGSGYGDGEECGLTLWAMDANVHNAHLEEGNRKLLKQRGANDIPMPSSWKDSCICM